MTCRLGSGRRSGPEYRRLTSVCVLFYIDRMKLTYPTALVLQALASGYHYGFDIMDATGLPSGTVYPVLRRLETGGAGALAMGEGGGARSARAARRGATTSCWRPRARSGWRPRASATARWERPCRARRVSRARERRARRDPRAGHARPPAVPRSDRRSRRGSCPRAAAAGMAAGVGGRSLHQWQGLEGEAAPAGAAPQADIVRRVTGALPDAAWLRRQLTADADLVHDLATASGCSGARPGSRGGGGRSGARHRLGHRRSSPWWTRCSCAAALPRAGAAS